jgi:hypothetical protein
MCLYPRNNLRNNRYTLSELGVTPSHCLLIHHHQAETPLNVGHWSCVWKHIFENIQLLPSDLFLSSECRSVVVYIQLCLTVITKELPYLEQEPLYGDCLYTQAYLQVTHWLTTFMSRYNFEVNSEECKTVAISTNRNETLNCIMFLLVPQCK